MYKDIFPSPDRLYHIEVASVGCNSSPEFKEILEFFIPKNKFDCQIFSLAYPNPHKFKEPLVNDMDIFFHYLFTMDDQHNCFLIFTDRASRSELEKGFAKHIRSRWWVFIQKNEYMSTNQKYYYICIMIF